MSLVRVSVSAGRLPFKYPRVLHKHPFSCLVPSPLYLLTDCVINMQIDPSILHHTFFFYYLSLSLSTFRLGRVGSEGAETSLRSARPGPGWPPAAQELHGDGRAAAVPDARRPTPAASQTEDHLSLQPHVLQRFGLLHELCERAGYQGGLVALCHTHGDFTNKTPGYERH